MKHILERREWLTLRESTVLDAATGQLGKKYKWGGSKPETGFDCSGLVSYATGLARTTADGYFKSKSLTKVKKEELKPGDLIFFGSSGRAHHIGIVDTVDANGKVTSMVHARGRESCPGNVATDNCKVEKTIHMDWYKDILGYGRV